MAQNKSIIPQIIPSLANGISQQSPAMRLRDQIEDSLNTRSTVITGTGSRTGTIFKNVFGLGTNTTTDFLNGYPFLFDRGPDGVYGGIVVNGKIRIWNLSTFQECTVSYPSGSSYIGVSRPSDYIRGVQAGDYFFFTNRSKTTAMTSAQTTAQVKEAHIVCRAANYGDVVIIKLKKGSGAISTWKMKAPPTAAGNGPLNSSTVAYAISTMLSTNAAPAGASVDSDTTATWTLVAAPATNALDQGFTITKDGPVLTIAASDGSEVTVTVDDQDNSKKIYAINKSVQAFTDLPAVFRPRARIKVSASAANNTLEYWVQYFETDDNGKPSTGYWKEVPAPSTKYALNNTTLPHALVATGTDTFEFKAMTWDERKIGSDTTTPPPSFIGQKIQDVCFVSGRLGLVMFDGICMSRSSDQPFNFWRQSSTQLLDTDPIDVLTGGAESVSFHSVSVVGNEPVLWSASRQYILTSPTGEALSPRTADLKPISSYQSPSMCPPLPFGDVAYFPTPGTNFVGMSMFSITPDSVRLGKSQSITDHVPAYIRNTPKQIVGSTSENMVVVCAGPQIRDLYVYEFMDTEDKGRVQSAWSRWYFTSDTRICAMWMVKSQLILLTMRGSELNIETMDIGSDKIVGPNTDRVCLDRRVGRYGEGAGGRAEGCMLIVDTDRGYSDIAPLYALPSSMSGWYVVITEPDENGAQIPIKTITDLTVVSGAVRVNELLHDKNFYLGRAPRVYIEPTEPIVRDNNGNVIFNAATLVSVGPVLAQTSGVTMRIGSKLRRKYAKLLDETDTVERDSSDMDPMDVSLPFVTGGGEFKYTLTSENFETTPKRFYKAAGDTSDFLLAFESIGPLVFHIVGLVYNVNVKGYHSGA